jgi:hypothetical protein
MWVVQENIQNEDRYEAFIAALKEFNIEHVVVKVVPFARTIIPDINPTGRVIGWGSISMDFVAKLKGWVPGTFLNDNFNQIIWSKAYGDNMLNADFEVFEFGKIPKFEGTKFIRPIHDMKVFAGTVIHGEEVENWKEAIQRISDGYSSLRPETPVSVSSVKDLAMEWRFFVVGGKVITGSRYRQYGILDIREVDESYASWQFAQKMVDHWQPAEAFVIDIVSLMNYDMKVIEINCINSAGFYAADMRAVVRAIENLSCRA